MTPLSQQLADLSVRAKETETRVASAQAEAREYLESRRAEVEKGVQGALDQVKQSFERAKTETQTKFASLQSKISSDIQGLKDRVAQARQEHAIERADDYAEDMSVEAALAIEYAAAAVRMAELAALDAIAARNDTGPQVARPTLTAA